MNGNGITATFSWDDGHPLDLRIARLFTGYGLKCTFYVPRKNSENLPTLSVSDLKSLSQENFDIHSHTLNHVYLNKLSSEKQAFEIKSGKAYVEDAVGKQDDIFCYPGGKYNAKTIDLVKEAGFKYARTVTMGSECAYSLNNYEMPTTCIIGPLTNFQILKHSLKRLSLRRGVAIAKINNAIIKKTWKPGNHNLNQPHCYHFWGHSWEIERHNLWDHLEALLQVLISSNVEIVSNQEFYDRKIICDLPRAI
jgi:peptidoglycan-N-acetylglucosamine deacetylase